MRQEVRVRCPSAPAPPAVREPVHRLHRDRKHEIRAIAGLDQLHQADGRNGSHQGPDEAGSGQGHIGDRGPIAVLTLGAQTHAAVGNPRDDDAGRDLEETARDRECALQLVAADDLPHVDEDRRVGVAQLDDVEEHLLLPGIGHRRRVAEPIAVERHRSVACATGEADRAHQKRDPRRVEVGQAPPSVRRVALQRHVLGLRRAALHHFRHLEHPERTRPACPPPGPAWDPGGRRAG